MTDGNGGIIAMVFLGIAGAWVFQLYLTYQQSMRFNDTLMPLRRQGRTAIGLGGKKFFGGRALVAIAHQGDTVVDARVMKGYTVFARPKPFPEIVGLSLTRLAGDDPVPGLPAKVRGAAQMAATTLLAPPKPDPVVEPKGSAE